MAVHDWARATAGIFHDFHLAWLAELRKAMNTGGLPKGHYALIEHQSGKASSHVETRTEMEYYACRRRTLAVRRDSDDQQVAGIEIVSLDKKSIATQHRQFVEKIVGDLNRGIHVLVIDILPPTRLNRLAVHQAIWELCSGESTYEAPPGKSLVLASYAVENVTTAYVEPLSIGDELPAMPLFLAADRYVQVPLETTYLAAWQGVPAHLQRLLKQ